MASETWKSVAGWEGYYEVSDFGRVLSVRSGKLLKLTYKRYVKTGLWFGNIQFNKYVHILVAEAFLGPCPSGKEVNHKDLDRYNNVPDNLEYLTKEENAQHAKAHGVGVAVEYSTNGRGNHSRQQVQDIKTDWVTGEFSRRQLAEKHEVSYSYVQQIVSGSVRSAVK